MFMGLLIPWTLFMLLGFPALQKSLFHLTTKTFIVYQVGWGALTVIGFFAYATLIILIIMAVFKTTRTFGRPFFIAVLITLFLWGLGISESLLSFKYLAPEGIVIREWYDKTARHYDWNEVKHVDAWIEKEVKSVKYSGGGPGTNMLRWKLTMCDRRSIRIEDAVGGDLLLLQNVYARLPMTVESFAVPKRSRNHWEYLRAEFFSVKIKDPDSAIPPLRPF